MIDITNAKWDLSKEEKSVIKWLDDNEYNGKILHLAGYNLPAKYVLSLQFHAPVKFVCLYR